MLNKKGSGQSFFTGSTSLSPKSSGQSTVEYILLVTAVIAIVLLFTNGKNSPFQQRLNSVFNMTSNSMVNVANRLTQ